MFLGGLTPTARRRRSSISSQHCCFLRINVMLPRLVALVVFFPATLSAQEKKVETHAIVLHPAPIPVPALKYPLLPEIRDLKPGNAALLYQRAHSPEWWAPLVRI